ncbi:MAG: hypothetical protein MUF81_16300 [Verrucomicrobia bacterium]|nr:hypothetical protein [Verrucomicrobiota bacterium]
MRKGANKHLLPGRARHSVRAARGKVMPGAHGVTRPTTQLTKTRLSLS